MIDTSRYGDAGIDVTSITRGLLLVLSSGVHRVSPAMVPNQPESVESLTSPEMKVPNCSLVTPLLKWFIHILLYKCLYRTEKQNKKIFHFE